MLLDSADFANAITTSVANCKKSILLASAFIKLPALDRVIGDLGNNIEVTVIARWQLHDLSFKASDLEVYEYCRKRGYKFGISLNFHGKLYAFDEKIILLGSANLTSRGMGFSRLGNTEFGTLLELQDQDSVRIELFLNSEIVWVDDGLFKIIAEKVAETDTAQTPQTEPPRWPIDFEQELTMPVEYLWIDELVTAPPQELLHPDFNSHSIVKDYDLLGLSIDELGRTRLVAAFLRTRQYAWLVALLAKRGSSNFGAISSALHHSVLDDPGPYRNSIKDFVAIIFEWAEYIPEHFTIERYNHTKAIDITRA